MFTRNVGLRGEWEGYRISDAVHEHGTTDGLCLSPMYRLGHHTPLATIPLAAAIPPRAAPRVPTPVAPSQPRHVSFSAEALVGFDSSAHQPKGSRDLNAFAEKLKTTRYGSIRVVGYTDGVGSAACNQKLSKCPAESVKAYLVETSGVEDSRILTEGKARATR